MKAFRYSILIPVLVLILSGCAPDLVVTSLQVTGPATINGDNSVELPVRVEVENEGNDPADIFKVSVKYNDSPTDPSGGFTVAFTVPGESNIWYPFTDAPLDDGDSVAYDGILTFHPSVHNVTVYLWAFADSCSGDEFMPDYCRVEESDENNNWSTSVSATLP